jgi:hypothetical protein
MFACFLDRFVELIIFRNFDNTNRRSRIGRFDVERQS